MDEHRQKKKKLRLESSSTKFYRTYQLIRTTNIGNNLSSGRKEMRKINGMKGNWMFEVLSNIIYSHKYTGNVTSW